MRLHNCNVLLGSTCLPARPKTKMDKRAEATKAFAEGRTNEALSLLEQLLAEDSTSELWNDWATVQFVRGDAKEAERGFNRSIELDRNNYQARLNLGLMHWSLGNREVAKPQLEAVLPHCGPKERQIVLDLFAQQALASTPPAQTCAELSGDQVVTQNAGPALPSASADLKILVVHDTLPHYRTLASDQRLMHFLLGLSEAGHKVTFIARDAVNKNTYENALRELNIESYSGDAARMRSLGTECAPSNWSFQQLLQERNFDVAFLTQSFGRAFSIPEHYLDDIRQYSPKTRIAIFAESLRGRSVLRQAEITGKIEDLELGNDLTQREREGFERADLVVASTPGDVQWLESLHKGGRVALLGSVATPNVTRKSSAEQHGVLLAGDLKSPGNLDGLKWFLQSVWPIVRRKSPKIDLLLAVENVPEEMESLLAGVTWSGGRDLPRFMELARIFISPLRFGVHAESILGIVANGVPGIITPIGSEATGLVPGAGIIQADTAEEFAAAILKVYGDRQLREELTEKGTRQIDQFHSLKTHRLQQAQALDLLMRLETKPPANALWSFTLIQTHYENLLKRKTADEQLLAQLDCYVRLGENLLRERKPQEALEQLRHVFGRLTGTIHRGVFLSQVLTLLKRCYRELGQSELEERCAAEARSCAADQAAATAKNKAARIAKPNSRMFSLIVPTYNRLPILKKCLAALETQTLPAKDFEVIVIDDGSSDGTEEAIRAYNAKFAFRYLRQKNSGTGMARCNGVNHATGEYLLLMNDDTIFEKDTLQRHMQAHRSYSSGKWAVLGNFQYPPAEARKRALTHFFCIEPFMFPQVMMEEGCPYGYSHFITCNLSVLRSAVVDAGSFDPTYKLSEDTELGIRLYERGFRVLFQPAAHAWHDHLPYAIPNLIRRARVYGADYFYMFQRHPRVLKEWALPLNLTAMDEENAYRILDYVERNRKDVENSVAALERWDSVEFVPILEKDPGMSALVMQLFRQALPAVHWFYLLETMLNTMKAQLGLADLEAKRKIQSPEGLSFAVQAGKG